jgi:hypothetical protein
MTQRMKNQGNDLRRDRRLLPIPSTLPETVRESVHGSTGSPRTDAGTQNRSLNRSSLR